VVAVTDADGERVASYNYEAFGTIKDATGALDNNITYTGRWLEPETGDYFYRARYYDSGVGRFLKRDPIGFGGRDNNFYSYTANNPIVFYDTYGFSKNCIMDKVLEKTKSRIDMTDKAIVKKFGFIKKDLGDLLAASVAGATIARTFGTASWTDAIKQIYRGMKLRNVLPITIIVAPHISQAVAQGLIVGLLTKPVFRGGMYAGAFLNSLGDEIVNRLINEFYDDISPEELEKIINEAICECEK
jgi:RHS repeat-associated protein